MPKNFLASRQRTVTEEPFIVDDSLFGRDLASLRRRALAFAVDVFVLFILGTPVLFLLALGALSIQAPSLAESIKGLMSGEGMDDSNQGLAELMMLTSKRNPGAVPSYLAEPISRGDLAEVERLLDETPLSISFSLSGGGPSYWDPINERLSLYTDVLYGPLASAAGFGALGLAYFTFFTRVGKGRTPGKWVAGTRTMLLSGKRIRWFDAFGRAGGYAASFSTLGLGLLQATRDPNRQALHDRIANTVVLRDTNRSLRRR